MTDIRYSDLALDWAIGNRRDRRFNLLALIVVTVMLALGILLSTIELPPVERESRRKVPPRIAEFLIERKKAQPRVEEPKPEVVKPKPKPKPEPQVKKKPREEQKPLTESQQEAREKAAQSGLLALSNELADLMETDDIAALVGGTVNSDAAAGAEASPEQALLLSQADSGSGGVGGDGVATTVGRTVLSKREVAAVKQSLVEPKSAGAEAQRQVKSETRRAGVRTVESVTLVFDQNKSVLYSLYNRARRKNPGLKGKIVLELTIAPSGAVTAIRIVSSELQDPDLETRLLKRIKQFKFGAQVVEEVKVTYPIDFLPS